MRSNGRQTVLTVARILLGTALVISGFTKAIDPKGTLYKLQEYTNAIRWESAFGDAVFINFAVLLSAAEFIIGVSLLVGAHRRLTSAMAMALMALMTVTTLWLWIANPVSDCGCFGDAIRLTNGQTLLKNVVLLAAAVFVWRFHRDIIPLPSVTARRLMIHGSLLYVLLIAAYAIYRLPLIDFRPYHVDTNIRQAMAIPEGKDAPQFETTFILEKNGQLREFTLEEYPDSTWTFVDSKTVKTKEGYQPPIHDFNITLQETGEDITEQVITHQGPVLLLIMYNLDKAQQYNYVEINNIYEHAKRHHVPFYCLTAGTAEQVVKWQKLTAAAYPFATTDETTLKTMIRSNPGLMLINSGIILAKWSNNNLPDPKEAIKPQQRQNSPIVQTALVLTPWLLFMLLAAGITLLAFKKEEKKVRNEETPITPDTSKK